MKPNLLIQFKKRKKVIGRGIGSGHGKTSTRGTKGQKARTGKKIRAGFEGGQTPLFQRLPKYRGFKNPNRIEMQVVNLNALESLKDKKITKAMLKGSGLIHHEHAPVKILGSGEVKKAYDIEADAISQSALKKLEAAGGTFIKTS